MLYTVLYFLCHKLEMLSPTRCEEKMRASQQEIGLDLVLGAKEELKACRAQLAASQRDSSYHNRSQDVASEEHGHCRNNLEKSLSLLKSCQSQLRNKYMEHT